MKFSLYLQIASVVKFMQVLERWPFKKIFPLPQESLYGIFCGLKNYHNLTESTVSCIVFPFPKTEVEWQKTGSN
jgi:hypothetical protein